MTRAETLEQKDLCQGKEPPPGRAPAPERAAGSAGRATRSEARFQERLVCGATPTAIRAIAFDLDSRSFLCEATPSLTCFVRFDNKSFRLRFEGEHLTTAAVGSAVGMRGADFGIEKSLCQESR